jgi:hypothetical protein
MTSTKEIHLLIILAVTTKYFKLSEELKTRGYNEPVIPNNESGTHINITMCIVPEDCSDTKWNWMQLIRR